MISIAVTISDDFSESLAALLRSIILSNSTPISFYIISDFISKENQQKLDATIRKSKIKLIFVTDVNLDTNDFIVDKHASPLNYYRVFLPQLLPTSLDKVIYLDSDLLVLNDLNPLWNVKLDNYSLAGVNQIIEERIQTLNLRTGNYINSGVLVVNLAFWRQENVTQRLTNFIHKNPKLLKYWDQDAINVVLEKSIKTIDVKWNYCKEYTDNLEIRILHFVGAHKPNSFHYRRNINKRLYYKHLLWTPYWKFKYFRYLF